MQNQVYEINDHKDIKFGFTPSKKNPADIASRGSTGQSIADNDLWWHGPEWLIKSEEEWPTQSTRSVIESEFESGIKGSGKPNHSEVFCVSITPNNTPLGIDPSTYSSVNKLIRVTALALRCLRKLRKRSIEEGPLKSTKLN